MNIHKNLELFTKGLGKNRGQLPKERYSSFDYCFNYFQDFAEKGNAIELSSPLNIQMSCLHLGFYLASWGMLRGSSFLLEKSIKFYEPLIEKIAAADKRLWKIDVDSYSDDNITLLLEFCHSIAESFERKVKLTDTLTTKIMLGVFANVPAYDDFFRKGFHVHSFGKRTLKVVEQFYLENKKEIDAAAAHFSTYDFYSGEKTPRRYPKAKIIDMIGFIEGQRILSRKKKD